MDDSPILDDPVLQAAFESEGYVVAPWLSAAEAAKVEAQYFELEHSLAGSFVNSHASEQMADVYPADVAYWGDERLAAIRPEHRTPTGTAFAFAEPLTADDLARLAVPQPESPA